MKRFLWAAGLLLLNLILSLGSALAGFYFMIQYWDTDKEFYLVLVGFMGAIFLAARGYFFMSGRNK